MRVFKNRSACFPGGSDGKESACSEETGVQSLGWEDPLEKAMAIFSLQIPWTEEPGWVQSMGKEVGITEQVTLT